MDNPERGRRYWAVRTDKDNRVLLFNELCRGLLRQGWGYDKVQDLRIIQSEIDKGGEWWARLSPEQKEAFPHMRMLSDSEDSMQIGDIVLMPNLPDLNRFCLGEVIGPYCFDILPLPGERDVNDLGGDYGHVLPVRLITEEGIDKYSNHVHAGIRATLKTPMRMWNLDGYGKHIERLLSLHDSGEDLLTASSAVARINIAWETAMSEARKVLQEGLSVQLDSKFQAAEWEEPILTVLRNLYGVARSSNDNRGFDIRWTAGRYEDGADVVVQIPNHFGGVPWLIVIQVKNYRGEIGSGVLSQIKQAYQRYSLDGQVLLGVIMTTAEKEAGDFDVEKDKLEKELNIPIKLILRNQLINIMTRGLSPDIV